RLLRQFPKCVENGWCIASSSAPFASSRLESNVIDCFSLSPGRCDIDTSTVQFVLCGVLLRRLEIGKQDDQVPKHVLQAVRESDTYLAITNTSKSYLDLVVSNLDS